MRKLFFLYLILPIFTQAMEHTQSNNQSEDNSAIADLPIIKQESPLLNLPTDMQREIALRIVQVHSGSVKDYDSIISLACTCKQMAAFVRDQEVQKAWEAQKPFLRANILPIIKQQRKERLERLSSLEARLRQAKIYVPLKAKGINATNAAGQTALECILKSPEYVIRGTELIRELLECGANINICDKQGKSLVYLMNNNYWFERYELSQVIIKSGTYINKVSREQVLRSMIESDSLNSSYYKYLVNNQDYDPNLGENGNTTLLHFDIAKFDGKHVELLVNKGANVNRCDKNNEPPLFSTVRLYGGAAIDITKYLIDQGANLQVINKEGESALMQARTQQMRELLMGAGAQITSDQATVLVEKALIKNCDDELMIFALNHGGQITKDLWKHIIDNRGIKKHKFDWLLRYESNFDNLLSVLNDELAWANLHRPYANSRAMDYEIAIRTVNEKIRQADLARIAQIRNPVKRAWAKFKHHKTNNK